MLITLVTTSKGSNLLEHFEYRTASVCVRNVIGRIVPITWLRSVMMMQTYNRFLIDLFAGKRRRYRSRMLSLTDKPIQKS